MTNQNVDLVALVTGADQGIGLQVAKELSENGFTVLVGSRNHENGLQATESIGQNALAIQLDVNDQRSIDAVATRMKVNLAGKQGTYAIGMNEDWQKKQRK